MALVVGRAQAVYGESEFQLDKPLHEYGIPESFANWSQGKDKSISYYPNATLRHVLTQTTGQGYAAPGTAFTYDSDEFIQYGSHVLSTFAKEHGNETAVDFASREFAAKLGLAPDLFNWDGVDGGGVSMGGGQRMSEWRAGDLLVATLALRQARDHSALIAHSSPLPTRNSFPPPSPPHTPHTPTPQPAARPSASAN